MSYFEFVRLDSDGAEIENTRQRMNTDTAVILNCHPACKTPDVRHLCEVARKTHNYPVDIAAWREINIPGEMVSADLVWSARIYWRDENYGTN